MKPTHTLFAALLLAPVSVLHAEESRAAGGWSFDVRNGPAYAGLLGAPPASIQGQVYGVPGAAGNGVEFPGRGGFLEIKDYRCDFRHGFTLMFWIKAPPDRRANRRILSFGNPGAPGHFQVSVAPAGFVRLALNGQPPIGCGAVDDGLWHHVAVVWNGQTLAYYLDDLDRGGPVYTFADIPDGIQKVSGAGADVTGVLRIGALAGGAESLRGTLDEVKIIGRLPEKPLKPPIARDPLILDPVWKTSKDGCLMFNPLEKNWWYFWMQHRTFSLTGNGDSVADHHGTAIAASVSEDGVNWSYRGTLRGLDRDPGLNTLWAPEIFWDEDSRRFHRRSDSQPRRRWCSGSAPPCRWWRRHR